MHTQMHGAEREVRRFLDLALLERAARLSRHLRSNLLGQHRAVIAAKLFWVGPALQKARTQEVSECGLL